MLESHRGMNRLRALIVYMTNVADFEPGGLRPVVQQLGTAAEETAMTAAERLRQQGRHQKAVELILHLLSFKFGDEAADLRSRVESGTEGDFERWSERVLTATTLNQVFDDSPLD